MRTEIITEPVGQPVTLAESKEHAVIEALFLDDDSFIDSLIIAATDYCERYISRTIGVYKIHQFFDRKEVSELLCVDDVDTINALSLFDIVDVETVLDESDYRVSGERIVLKTGVFNPFNLRDFDAIKIDFQSKDNTNERFKTAVKQIVTHWYEQREAVNPELVQADFFVRLSTLSILQGLRRTRL